MTQEQAAAINLIDFLVLMLVFTAVWTAAGYAVAYHRGIDTTTGVVLGLLLGPLGVVILFVMRSGLVPCPACDRNVSRRASRCPHCRSVIESFDEYGRRAGRRPGPPPVPDHDPAEPAVTAAPPKKKAVYKLACPACGSGFQVPREAIDGQLPPAYTNCPRCRTRFRPDL